MRISMRMPPHYLLHVETLWRARPFTLPAALWCVTARARSLLSCSARRMSSGYCRVANSSATRAPVAGARREVIEETGHRVRVREFVGAITYRARGRPKVVQFWRMQAEANPSRDLMEDIMAVKWLPLSAAIRKLSYPLESLFLRNVGRNILRSRRKNSRHRPQIEIAPPRVKTAPTSCRIAATQTRKDRRLAGDDAAACARAPVTLKRARSK